MTPEQKEAYHRGHTIVSPDDIHKVVETPNNLYLEEKNKANGKMIKIIFFKCKDKENLLVLLKQKTIFDSFPIEMYPDGEMKTVLLKVSAANIIKTES